MSQPEVIERLRADVSRLLALIDHYEIVRDFKNNWALFDRHGDNFEIQVERVKHSLADAEKLS